MKVFSFRSIEDLYGDFNNAKLRYENLLETTNLFKEDVID